MLRELVPDSRGNITIVVWQQLEIATRTIYAPRTLDDNKR